jgi:hypothetical protein
MSEGQNTNNLQMALIMSDVKHGGDAQKFLKSFVKSGHRGTAYDEDEDEIKPRRTYTQDEVKDLIYNEPEIADTSAYEIDDAVSNCIYFNDITPRSCSLTGALLNDSSSEED